MLVLGLGLDVSLRTVQKSLALALTLKLKSLALALVMKAKYLALASGFGLVLSLEISRLRTKPNSLAKDLTCQGFEGLLKCKSLEKIDVTIKAHVMVSLCADLNSLSVF